MKVATLRPSSRIVSAPVTGLSRLIFELLPLLGLYGLFIGVFSLDWLARDIGIIPSASRYLLDGLLLILLVAVVLKRVVQKKGLRRTPIDLPVLLLIGTGIFSAFINVEPLLLALLGFRNLFKPILLFYILVNLDLESRKLRHLIIFLMVLELIQLPVMAIQAYQFGGGGDRVTGTFGFAATGNVAIVALMIMAVFYGLAMTQAQKGVQALLYGMLGTSLFTAFIFGESKAGFLIAPLMLLFLVSRGLVRQLTRGRTWFVVFLFAGIFYIGVQLMPLINPKSGLVRFLESPGLLVTEYDRPLESTNGLPASRLGDLQLAWQLITPNPQSFLLGFGPAESIETSFIGITGELRRTHDLGIFLGFHQLSRTLLEWGAIGLVVYMTAIAVVYQRINSNFKRGAFMGFWRGIAFGFRGVAFVFVLGTYYLPIWETEATGYIFWTLAACLLVVGARAGKKRSVAAVSRHKTDSTSGVPLSALRDSLPENG